MPNLGFQLEGAIIHLQIHIAKYTIWKQQNRDKAKPLPEDVIQKNTAEFKRTHLLCHKKTLLLENRNDFCRGGL